MPLTSAIDLPSTVALGTRLTLPAALFKWIRGPSCRECGLWPMHRNPHAATSRIAIDPGHPLPPTINGKESLIHALHGPIPPRVQNAGRDLLILDSMVPPRHTSVIHSYETLWTHAADRNLQAHVLDMTPSTHVLDMDQVIHVLDMNQVTHVIDMVQVTHVLDMNQVTHVSKKGLMRVLDKDQAIHEPGMTLLTVVLVRAPQMIDAPSRHPQQRDVALPPKQSVGCHSLLGIRIPVMQDLAMAQLRPEVGMGPQRNHSKPAGMQGPRGSHLRPCMALKDPLLSRCLWPSGFASGLVSAWRRWQLLRMHQPPRVGMCRWTPRAQATPPTPAHLHSPEAARALLPPDLHVLYKNTRVLAEHPLLIDASHPTLTTDRNTCVGVVSSKSTAAIHRQGRSP